MKLFWYLSPLYKYRITGKSMVPTFMEGDIVLVNRMAYLFTKPQLNDIIVLRDPRNQSKVIKRITKISHDCYFVEGDNKKESTDSRVYGEIERKAIIGKVISLQ